MDGLQRFLQPEFVWLAVGVILLISEFIMPGFVIFFFGLGACLVGAACWLWDLSLNRQLLMFLVSSLFLLVALRSWIKNVFLGHVSQTNGEEDRRKEFIGKRAVVVKAIRPAFTGKVELHGTEWDAQSPEAIPEGTVVKVVGLENLTLNVVPFFEQA